MQQLSGLDAALISQVSQIIKELPSTAGGLCRAAPDPTAARRWPAPQAAPPNNPCLSFLSTGWSPMKTFSMAV